MSASILLIYRLFAQFSDMVYETSYESGHKPFSPDLQRGKWEKPTDFIYACCGLALKLDLFVVSYWFFFDMGCKLQKYMVLSQD